MKKLNSFYIFYGEIIQAELIMYLQFCTVTCHVFVEEISMVSLLTYLTETCIVTVFLLAKTREGIWNRLKLSHREWCIKMRVVVVRVLEITVILTIVTW